MSDPLAKSSNSNPPPLFETFVKNGLAAQKAVDKAIASNNWNVGRDGASATYTFREGDGVLTIVAHVNCGRDHIVRSFDVAEIHDPENSMPGLTIKTPLGINAVEDVCAIVRSLLIGPRTVPGRTAVHTDLSDARHAHAARLDMIDARKALRSAEDHIEKIQGADDTLHRIKLISDEAHHAAESVTALHKNLRRAEGGAR